jgi:hypothetical protein
VADGVATTLTVGAAVLGTGVGVGRGVDGAVAGAEAVGGGWVAAPPLELVNM